MVRFDKDTMQYYITRNCYDKTTNWAGTTIPASFARELFEFMQQEYDNGDMENLIDQMADSYDGDPDSLYGRYKNLVTANPSLERAIIEHAAEQYRNYQYYDCGERDNIDREECLADAIKWFEED